MHSWQLWCVCMWLRKNCQNWKIDCTGRAWWWWIDWFVRQGCQIVKNLSGRSLDLVCYLWKTLQSNYKFLSESSRFLPNMEGWQRCPRGINQSKRCNLSVRGSISKIMIVSKVKSYHGVSVCLFVCFLTEFGRRKTLKTRSTASERNVSSPASDSVPIAAFFDWWRRRGRSTPSPSQVNRSKQRRCSNRRFRAYVMRGKSKCAMGARARVCKKGVVSLLSAGWRNGRRCALSVDKLFVSVLISVFPE